MSIEINKPATDIVEIKMTVSYSYFVALIAALESTTAANPAIAADLRTKLLNANYACDRRRAAER